MRVPLTRGAFAVIDATDWDLVKDRNWICSKSGYAASALPNCGLLYMHVHIYGDAGDGMVDHKDRDTLNNRRSNLRPATFSQNQANSFRRKGRSRSGFRGVYPSGYRWMALIHANKVKHTIGFYDTPEEAAQAYNAAAIQHFGEFAVLNEIPEQGR